MDEICNLFKAKRPKKVSLLKLLFSNPDDFEYNLKVVDDEIRITIKKQEEGAE